MGCSMDTMNSYIQSLENAREILGDWRALAKVCGVSYQAIQKWRRLGRPPRTEYTGETRYAAAISRATQGQVSVSDLRPPLTKRP